MTVSYFASKLNLSLIASAIFQIVSLFTGEVKPTAQTITPAIVNVMALGFRVQDETQKRAARK
mgnify:CR=1 FL=1